MSEIPVEVYETIAQLNRASLNKAIDDMDFRAMYRSFDRLAHALEQVEQYKLDQARKHKL